MYAGKDGAFTLYEDEGTNYNYEKGMLSKIKFLYSENDHSLTIDAREGTFPGMLEKRFFIIHYNTKEKSSALDFHKNEGSVIIYNGKKQTIHFK